VKDAVPGANVVIEVDRDFDLKGMSRNEKDFQNRTNATRIIDGLQVNGNIILPWSFVTVTVQQ
jgi:hypothetical protein